MVSREHMTLLAKAAATGGEGAKTVAGAVKALIKGAGLGDEVYVKVATILNHVDNVPGQ